MSTEKEKNKDDCGCGWGKDCLANNTWPEKKTWDDDRAMTISPSSDNYKMGWNECIKEFKRLNERKRKEKK